MAEVLFGWYHRTASSGIETFSSILKLQDQTNRKLQSLGSRANNAHKVVQYLYKKPLIDAEKIKEVARISMPTAYTLLSNLEELGILQEVTGGQRSRVYMFGEYLKLFKQ